ncbi:hypothetical protein PINS_up004267 [Pythium insidiosum]|nr:hypothetical protein PINS_up004267 [Pythium insidiosum]
MFHAITRSALCAAMTVVLALHGAKHSAQAQEENPPVLGGWPEIAIGEYELALLVQATGNASSYDPAVPQRVCMKDVFRLHAQVVAGTNFRYQGHGCLLAPEDTQLGSCNGRQCAYEALQVTIFTQEWSATTQVINVERIPEP